jgi:hypothetical protein
MQSNIKINSIIYLKLTNYILVNENSKKNCCLINFIDLGYNYKKSALQIERFIYTGHI